jgi:hypothetical protein
MVNGIQGDHPLTDILIHHIEVYGEETDNLIRKISELSSQRELNEWWEKEIGWAADKKIAYQKAQQRHRELLKRAKESGWESA